MTYIISLLVSFFLAIGGLSLGGPISHYVDSLNFYYSEKFGIKNTLLSSFVSTLYSFVHWGSWESFKLYTWPLFSGLLLGLLIFFFPVTQGVRLYGYLFLTIAIAGLIVYFFPEFFNVSTDWDRIVTIPISIVFIICGVGIVPVIMFLCRFISEILR
jgi:hypothetical protein